MGWRIYRGNENISERTPPEGRSYLWNIWVVDEDNQAIAQIHSNDDAKLEANANLIVAAPELYDKVLKICHWLEMLLRNAEHQLISCRFITLKKALEADVENYKATLKDIRMALIKAEGK